MNRITQCIHGRGTVSGVMHCQGAPADAVPARYLAFAGTRRPVVFWNLTDRCNLSCIHCYSRSGPAQDPAGELTHDEAVAVIDDCAAAGVPLILFTGGEPLMRPDLFALCRHARDRGIRTALSTNGTLITSDTARALRACGVGYVGISLDGARPETHDAFRNAPGAFRRACAAFASCRGAGVRCGVRVTLTRGNAPELGDLVDLARFLGAGRFCLYWPVPCGRGKDAYARLRPSREAVVAALDLLYRKAREIDPSEMEFLTVDAPQDCIHLLDAMERGAAPDLPAARGLIGSLGGGCSAGDRVADIDARGNVYPCQFARSPVFLAGNVRQRKFSEIFADPKNPVLEQFRKRPRVLAGACGRCNHQEICGGGCRVRAYEASGDLTAADPFCFAADGAGCR